MSFWEKTKQAAKDAADATQRAAKRLGYRTEISLKRRKIRQLKEAFGPRVYQAFEDNDLKQAQTIFEEVQKQVEAINEEIHVLEDKILALDEHKDSQGGSGATTTTTSDAPPVATWKTKPASSAPPSRPTFAAPSPTHSAAATSGAAAASTPTGTAPGKAVYEKPARPGAGTAPARGTSAGTKPGLTIPTTTTTTGPSPTASPRAAADEKRVMCGKCGQAIVGESIEFGPSEYHPGCFKCATCEKKFVGDKCLLISGKPYCDSCGRTAFVASKSSGGGAGTAGGFGGGGGGKALTGMPALLAWCQQCTNGFNGVTIKNWTTSWHNGLAFAAILANFRPDVVDWKSVNPNDPLKTIQAAFDAAEKVGVAILIDAGDVSEADNKSMFTQLTMYHRVFGSQTSNPAGKKEWNSKVKA